MSKVKAITLGHGEALLAQMQLKEAYISHQHHARYHTRQSSRLRAMAPICGGSAQPPASVHRHVRTDQERRGMRIISKSRKHFSGTHRGIPSRSIRNRMAGLYHREGCGRLLCL
jgi:hypothetical protein